MSQSEPSSRDDEPVSASEPTALEVMGRPLERIARLLATIGGIILLLVTAVTVISVVGRVLFAAPILGDAEIVELGCALAIFSFLPYCQLRGGNVVVDVFTTRASPRTRALLDAANGLVFTLVVVLLTWRLVVGSIDTISHNEFSMFLRIPMWWGYAGAILPMVVWGLACLYTAMRLVWGNPADSET